MKLMSIEDYQDHILTKLAKAGVTEAELAANSMMISMLVSHCHMKGSPFNKVIPGILARIREQR